MHGRRGRTLSQVQGRDGEMVEKGCQGEVSRMQGAPSYGHASNKAHQNKVAGNVAQQGATLGQPNFRAQKCGD